MEIKETTQLNTYIEHTLLKPDATSFDVKTLCYEATEHQFAAVCVPPFYVKNAAMHLYQTNVEVKTVIGYPLGYTATSSKVEEVKRAANDGVDAVEMLINVAAVKDKQWAHVYNDIDSVLTAARIKSKKAFIVLETGLLTKDEIIKLCELCNELKVDGVKNASGFNSTGATNDIILLLKQHLTLIPIIASGGIHQKAPAIEFLQLGATRIATSSGVQLIQ